MSIKSKINHRLLKIDNSVLWNFLNRPLVVALILGFLTSVFVLKYGYKEKVKCNFMINPDVDYLKNQENADNDTVLILLRLYSKPFIANLTFDNYQEALAFKYLTIDGQNHGKWYKPTLNCGNKIQLPMDFKDLFNK